MADQADNGNGRVTIALLQQGQTEILKELVAIARTQERILDRVRDLELDQSRCQSNLAARVSECEQQQDRLEGRLYGLATGNFVASGLMAFLSRLIGG